MSPKEFRQGCVREFSYLIDEFGFRLEKPLEGDRVHRWQARFASDSTRVVITGVSYGTNVMVTVTRLDSQKAYFVDRLIRQQNRRFKPIAPSASSKIQERQIKHYAVAIRQHLGNLLRGDFSMIDKNPQFETTREYH